jgi:diguanylate cyclase (GGDEF)-like protein
MATERCKRVHFGTRMHRSAIRAWPLWELPRRVVIFIVGVTAVYAAVIGFALTTTPLVLRDVLLCGALMLCTAATVELTRRAGENAGVIRDVYAVWELPLAILLPPVYCLVVPAFRCALTQCRIRRVPLYRRVFSSAGVGLSYACASAVFHAVTGEGFNPTIGPRVGAAWIVAVALAGAVQWAVNAALLLPAIKGADPSVRIRDMILAREAVQNDATELCVAVLVTLGIAVTPLTIVFAFPFVTLLQRSFRHVHLVNASRVDSKTGLLNAGTWEREAASEVARAVRTHSPLAVALVDIDHFKAVNDSFGHLAGDKALREVARTLTIFLREYDLVGRFGGEEFAILLPHAKAVDAYRIAERIRAYISAMPIDVHDDPAAQPVRLSISIGVAALGARWDSGAGGQLTDLLAAADGALYQAKQNGRDQVCVITENTTFGLREEAPAGAPPKLDLPSRDPHHV